MNQPSSAAASKPPFFRLEADQVANRAREALRDAGLDAFWQCLSLNQSKAAPYHNEYHALKCVALCAEAARFEKLDRAQTRSLTLASLFHDFDHSAGRMGEAQNIDAAVSALTRSVARYQMQLDRPLTLSEVSAAVTAIEASAFPYRGSGASLVARIVRDADRMQPYETDTVRLADQFVGLKHEQEQAEVTVRSIREFARDMDLWLRHIAWGTAWGEARADALGFERNYLDRLSSLLNRVSVSFHTLRPRPPLASDVADITASA